ncbi:winged helix-turn-helix transcriptional regulator [Breznakiella homolactica]|uniref:Winged helix-turn-helix transcriptional regulator n=2 Tax=Breznakiella homolactica TaxID=2798577 RepID=A0A7T7XK42_9SPIR|nr:winged helix-turn-helix transcriptional regulator [Breznakiella homolactica]
MSLNDTIRVSKLRKEAPGITNTMRTNTLRELEADGLIHREQFNEILPRQVPSLSYSLSYSLSVSPNEVNVREYALLDEVCLQFLHFIRSPTMYISINTSKFNSFNRFIASFVKLMPALPLIY